MMAVESVLIDRVLYEPVWHDTDTLPVNRILGILIVIWLVYVTADTAINREKSLLLRLQRLLAE